MSQPEPVKDERKLQREEKEKAKKAAKLLKFQAKQKKLAEQALTTNNNKKERKGKIASPILPEEEVFVDKTIPGEKKILDKTLFPSYQPKRVECSWYDWWTKNGFFKPEFFRKQNEKSNSENHEKFVIVIPPPNVTGTLHLGHALTNTVEDALVRYARMCQKETLWVPATDHAGIATQVVVEKKIARERNLTRHDVGREAFVKEVWEWKEQYGGTIKNQLKRLGSSLDWDREAFTMDERLSRAVTETFCRLHEKGLIYRENRLVNWCCALNTGISDIEVDYKDIEKPTSIKVPGHGGKEYIVGEIISFAYKIADGKEGEEVVCATTRLETMLGDTAVAVHPDDTRYTHLHGKYVIHPFDGRRIPIICDPILVDLNFGTGCVKVTPAHDPNDYACGTRNKLEFITMLAPNGTIAPGFGKFSGMPRFEARNAILEEMKTMGFYRGTQVNPMRIGFCSRTKDVIEPRLMPQWYVNCSGMAKKAIEKAKTNELQFFPESQKQTWYRWLESIRDWCVSRQLWWGHQIPAYAVKIKGMKEMDPLDNNSWVVGRDQTEAMKKACERFNCKEEDVTLTRDSDVLDTWFSSGVYPFSVFGWPDETTDDFQRYFPTNLLETGHDILFFWVARMVMLSLEITGKLPFNQVYLHAMVRDAHGRKMSKSLGNVIDPIDVINGITLAELNAKLLQGNLANEEIIKATEGQKADYPNGIAECGTDALRFALCAYTSQGRDINLDINRVIGYRNFCNKIWNATRFGLMKLTGIEFSPVKFDELKKLSFSQLDCWILSKLSKAIKGARENMEKYELSAATNYVYNFWLYELCDIYLESIKPIFLSDDEKAKEVSRQTLCLCLDFGLRLLHPFMPFVTEELWQHLPKHKDDSDPISIMIAEYPPLIQNWLNEELEAAMEEVFNIVQKIRGLNASHASEIKKNDLVTDVYIVCTDEKLSKLYESYLFTIALLSYTKNVKVCETLPEIQVRVSAVVNKYTTAICDVKGMEDPKPDTDKFITKMIELKDKLNELNTEISLSEKMISNPGFETNTPPQVQAKIIQKLEAKKIEVAWRSIRCLTEQYETVIDKNRAVPNVYIVCSDEKLSALYVKHLSTITSLSFSNTVEVCTTFPEISGSVLITNESTNVICDLKGFADPKLEIEKFNLKLTELKTAMSSAENEIKSVNTPQATKDKLILELDGMTKREETISSIIKSFNHETTKNL